MLGFSTENEMRAYFEVEGCLYGVESWNFDGWHYNVVAFTDWDTAKRWVSAFLTVDTRELGTYEDVVDEIGDDFDKSIALDAGDAWQKEYQQKEAELERYGY